MTRLLRRPETIGFTHSNIAWSMRGTPGKIAIRSMKKPGAGESGFGISVAPFGTWAISIRYSGFDPLYGRASSAAFASGCTINGTPATSATASRVMSSGVGPIPPVRTRRSTSSRNRRRCRTTTGISSGRIAHSAVSAPHSASSGIM